MKTLRTFFALAVVACRLVRAQDVSPPPKPQDSGPSLEATMKFIQERLEAIGPVNYIAYLHDNLTGNDWTDRDQNLTSEVKAIPATCLIEFDVSLKRTIGLDDGTATTWHTSGKLNLKSVLQVKVLTREQQMKETDASAGHPEWSARVDPPVFVLRASAGLVDSKTRHHYTSGPDSYTNEKVESNLDFYFLDESMANRVAKAIVHAVELCGGGNKDPF
jgi:hypothetical protein